MKSLKNFLKNLSKKLLTNPLKLTLSISFIGIFLLLSITTLMQPKLIAIEEINHKYLNKNIKIQGEIQDIRTYQDSFQVIPIKDETAEIDIITNEILNLTKSESITVIGKVQEYKQYLQVQANKIMIDSI